MILFSRVEVRRAFTVLGLLLIAGFAEAQNAATGRAVTGSFDMGGISNDFGSRCWYKETDHGVGATIGGLVRPRPGLIITADIRANAVPTGCKASAPGPSQIGPNEWEHWAPRQYPDGVASSPLVRNAVHVGIERPILWIFRRVLIGGGMIWTGDPTPFASLAIGGGSMGSGSRFFWELDVSAARVRVREFHGRFRVESNGEPTPLPPRNASFIAYPRWTMLRLGLAVPLARQ